MNNKLTNMKAVILAGGLGTRLSEETYAKPKPMVEIGGKPILWHIMKIYSSQGVNDFIVCSGYKGNLIKEYFSKYFLNSSDVTFELDKNLIQIQRSFCEPWRVTIVDTGESTMTGGRLARIAHYLEGERFFFTYGDGVADIDLLALLNFHTKNGKAVTLTAVKPPGRYGSLTFQSGSANLVSSFSEKPAGDGVWINGGFFVLEKFALDYIKKGDDTVWEKEPLEQLAQEGELAAYRHNGFWKPMDTIRDMRDLETLWSDGNAPWMTWKK